MCESATSKVLISWMSLPVYFVTWRRRSFGLYVMQTSQLAAFHSVNLTMKGSIPHAVRARDLSTGREVHSKEYKTSEAWPQALVG